MLQERWATQYIYENTDKWEHERKERQKTDRDKAEEQIKKNYSLERKGGGKQNSKN